MTLLLSNRPTILYFLDGYFSGKTCRILSRSRVFQITSAYFLSIGQMKYIKPEYFDLDGHFLLGITIPNDMYTSIQQGHINTKIHYKDFSYASKECFK